MSDTKIDLERREFLKKLAYLGLISGLGGKLVLPRELWAMAPESAPLPLVAQVQGTNYAGITGEAVQALGGMKKFVNPGEVVVIKPNISFDRPPELGANVHPAVVRQIVELCLDAGAKRVKVFDRPNYDPRKTYKNSGIEAALQGIKDPRVILEFVDERRYVEVKAEKAKALKTWYYYRDVLDADRFINIAVAKHHARVGLTMCLKNVMGTLGGHRQNLHPALSQNIADMNLILRPDLHILDATRIMLRNGPSGGRPEDVEVKNQVFAGTDPVALDAVGTSLFGLKPGDIEYIKSSFEAGRGEMDLNKIKVLGG
jgi:uncharacterized protein (DUF362 family)